MQSFNYNDPVKYEPPPPTPKGIPKWLLIVVGVVGGLAILGFLAFSALKGAFKRNLAQNIPPAGVKVGSQLQWRVLETKTVYLPTQSGALGGLLAADFDADGDEEVLLISKVGQSEIIEVDGTSRKVMLGGPGFMMGAVPWDFDRDGIAEIVVETGLGDVMAHAARGNASAENIPTSQNLPVYDLGGKVVARLDAVGHFPGDVMSADLDGNGFLELLAHPPSKKSKYGGQTWVGFGKDGKKVWKQKEKLEDTFSTIGDIDGDGMDEILFLTNRLSTIKAIGHKQEMVEIKGFSGPKVSGDLVGDFVCLDLDADGVDEIVFPGQGILNPVTQTISKLKWPNSDFLMLMKCSPIDLNSDGQFEVAITGMMASAIYIFDSSGNCKYYEEFGDMVMGATSVTANNQTYIVMQFMEQLLIYP